MHLNEFYRKGNYNYTRWYSQIPNDNDLPGKYRSSRFKGNILLLICAALSAPLTCVFAFEGAVPLPESLLLSPPPLVPLEPMSTASLLSSVSPAHMEELRRTCKGNMHCIHDIIASGSSELGLHTLEARQKLKELALIYGETRRAPRVFVI